MNQKILRVILLVTLSALMAGVAVGAQERILHTNWTWPLYLDPGSASDLASTVAMVNVYDPLVFPDTSGAPQPHLALSWEASADGLTWTFHLRHGAKFHDGTEVTADDVKYSMDRLEAMGQGYAYLFLGRVASTEVIDNYTVRFNMAKPFGPFLSVLFQFFIVNKDLVGAHTVFPGAYGDAGDYGREWLRINDAGSGAYAVKELRVAEKLTLQKNPEYWGYIDPFAADEFVMIGTTQAATVRTLMSRRELEITDKYQTPQALAALDEIEGIDIAEFSVNDKYYLQLNTKKPPTDDLHFRRAMAWAFDYNEAVKLYPGSSQGSGPVASQVPGADPNAFRFTRDLNKALEELKLSKYYGNLDAHPVELHWAAEVAAEEQVSMLFMADMAEIGIKVNVVRVPWVRMAEESAAADTAPNIFTLINSPTYPEAGAQLQARYHSSTANTWMQNEFLLDPVLDGMIEDALATIDREERFSKYAAISTYIMDLCPSIYVLEPVERHAYQSAYIDWAEARGEGIPAFGYRYVVRLIRVYPEQRAALLK